jgi:type II secretory pathway predicted ATPase ExeA/phage tail protein X
VYWSQTHQSAYRHLLYSVQSSKSLIVLAGAVGAGKTTLLHVLMEWVKTTEPTTRLAYVVHSTLTVMELLCYISHELGLDCSASNKIDYVLALQRFSRQCAEHGERLLLILDEAQNYSHDVLEEIRLLSNIETPQDQQLQIILAGQPQLLTNMNQHDIYQLKQRVNVTYNLLPLNYGETHAYIQTRLDVAGAQGRSLFHDEAIDAIYQYTQGLPRVINVLCDHALLYAFSANKEQVSKKIVREAAVDMSLHQGQGPHRASTDTPDAGEEAMTDANHQADRIIIDYTKNYLGQGGANTSPRRELFGRSADWSDGWENDATGHRRRSLWQFTGIAIFIILILTGILFVQIPSLQNEISTITSFIIGKNREDVNNQQKNLQSIPGKSQIDTIKEQSKLEKINNDVNNNDHIKTLTSKKEESGKNTDQKSGKNTDQKNSRHAIVRSGDTFEKILLKAYGQYDKSLVSLVLEANPDIVDVNTIFVGQRIRLPEP